MIISDIVLEEKQRASFIKIPIFPMFTVTLAVKLVVRVEKKIALLVELDVKHITKHVQPVFQVSFQDKGRSLRAL